MGPKWRADGGKVRHLSQLGRGGALASWHSQTVSIDRTDTPFANQADSGPALDRPESPMLAVYGHTITWRHLILTAVLLIVLMSALAVVVGWWAWHNLAVRVALREQQALVHLPESLAVRAEVTRQVAVRIDQTLPVRVPIQQDLLIPIKDAIPVQVSIDTVLPIKLDVPVRQTIHLDQVVDIDTHVRTRVLGIGLTLPIQGRVPVKADVPIDMVIPVRKDLPVALTTLAQVRITEPVRTRIDTVIQAQVPIHESLRLPVTEPVDARLTFPQQRLQAGLDLMELTIPFEAVTMALRRTMGAAP